MNYSRRVVATIKGRVAMAAEINSVSPRTSSSLVTLGFLFTKEDTTRRSTRIRELDVPCVEPVMITIDASDYS